MRILNSDKHALLIDDINNKLDEIHKEQYNVLHEWEQELRTFINDDSCKYFVVDHNIYVMLKHFDSGVIRQGWNVYGKSKTKEPTFWANLNGLVVHDKQYTIADSFGLNCQMRPGRTIQKIDESEFMEKFNERCKLVFCDTEGNFKFQLDNFPYGFYRIIDDVYSEYFPDDAHKFIEKLDIALDSEIDDNKD